MISLAWEKPPIFLNVNTGFPAKWRLRNWHRNFTLMTCHFPHMGIASDWLQQTPWGTTTQKHYLVLGSASDWLKQISHASRPIRSTTQIWIVWHVISMEFLRSFHRPYFAGIPVVAWRNVGSFLRLSFLSSKFQCRLLRHVLKCIVVNGIINCVS